MDNDPDLYEDLPDFHAPDYIAKLETKVEVLEKRVKQLESALTNSEHEKRNIQINNERDKRNLLNSNENLLVNVSTLFKTAKKEIERKDNTIKELREQLDDFVFRRHRKPWPPRNDVVQSQNEDDAICTKPVSEDSNAINSIIRPNTKNLNRNDREKSSNSEVTSLSFARLNTNHHEYPNKDKHSDLTRVKYVESSNLERKPKEFNDVKYSNFFSTSGSHREEHCVNKNSSDTYHYRRTDRKIRNGDNLNRDRVDSKSKDRQRYSPYEHHKDEHDRSRHKSHRHDRDHKNEDPLKPRPKRSSADRNQSRHEFDDGHRSSKDDFRRLDVDFGGRKSYDNRKKVHSSRNMAEFDDRRSDSEFGSRKSYGDTKGHDHRIDPTLLPHKSMMDRRKEDPVYSSRVGVDNRRPNAEFSNRQNDNERIRDEAIDVVCRYSIDNRLCNSVNPVIQKSSSNEAQRRSGSRSITEERKHDTSNLSDTSVNGTATDDNLENFIKNLNDKYKNSNDLAQDEYEDKRYHGSGDSDRHTGPEHYLNSKRSPRSQSLVRSQRSKPLHTSLPVDGPTETSEPLLKCTSRHQITELPNLPESRPKPTEISQTTLTASSNHILVDVSSKTKVRRYKQSNSMKNSLGKKSKIAVNQIHSEVPVKTVGSRLEEASSQRTEVSSSPPHEICSKKAKHTPSSSPPAVPVKSANSLANASSQPVRHSPPEMQELLLNSARMSQNSPISFEECSQPVDRHMQVLKILAQYGGIYATPLKEFLNGDKCFFAANKLSPISATPDYMKALLYDSKTKVSPIPMLNERRVLDGFNSPVKETVAPTEEPTKDVRKSPVIAENSSNSDEKSKERPPSPNDSNVAKPSPRKSLQLNTVVKSPFKNCCIVKVQAETINNANAETDDKVQSAEASGTDTTNAEHGVFMRKRRAPVRHIRRSES